MTVNLSPLRYAYSGNGVTRTFPFRTGFLAAEDLTVTVIDAAGAASEAPLFGAGASGWRLVETRDPERGYPGGATVRFNAAPVSGVRIDVARIEPITQELELVDAFKFPAAPVNMAFDKLTMICQQLFDDLSRTISREAWESRWNAQGYPIGNVGTPTLPEDATTKSYVDNGGFIGAIEGNQYVDGIYVDTRGTGTPDDTAIWTQAIADAVSLGYYKLYFRRPTNVKNLTINDPIEIVGVHGMAEFRLAASGTNSDIVLRVKSDGVKLRGFKVVMPVTNWLTPATQPAGSRGIYIASGTTTATSRPLVNVALEDITIVGGVVGVWFIGGDRITINNLECRLQYGFGCVLGGNLPITKCRVQGFRAVSCGSYGITLSQFDTNAPFNYGDSDIEIYGCYLIDCGKWGLFTGYAGGIKYGADMTTTSLRRLRFQGESIYCGGGIEIKNTLGTIPTVFPSAMKDIDVQCNVVVDHEVGGGGMVVCNGRVEDEVDSVSRIVVHDSYIHYVGPKTWFASYPYEVGDAITNAGNIYWCAGNAAHLNDLSGAVGAPTGTGTGVSSYFDGNLYWYYIGTFGGVPPQNFIGFRIDAVGNDAGAGLTVANIELLNCSHAFVLHGGNSLDNTIYNLILDGIKVRNCLRGILDGGNQFSGAPGFIKNLRIIDCDFDCLTVAVQLGATGNGTTTGGGTVTNAQIRGGRFFARDNVALYIEAQCDLKIGGGARFACGGASDVAYLSPRATGSVVQVEHAHFESGGGSHFVLRADASATWDNVGAVNMVQPSIATQAVAQFSGGAFIFRGSVCRGIVAGNPAGAYAGYVGEYLKLATPTSTVSEYVCTVAGAAGGAVWTPRL